MVNENKVSSSENAGAVPVMATQNAPQGAPATPETTPKVEPQSHRGEEKKARKSSKKGLVALIIITVLAILVAAGAIWLFLKEYKRASELEARGPEKVIEEVTVEKDGETIILETESLPESEAEVRQLVTEIAKKIQDDWAKVVYGQNTWSEGTYDLTASPSVVTYYSDNVRLYYQPEGLNAAVPLSRGYGIYVSRGLGYPDEGERLIVNRFTSGAVAQEIMAFLQQRGFAQAKRDGELAEYVNKEQGIICSFTTNQYQPTFDCSKTTWYDADKAEFIEEVCEESGLESCMINVSKDNIKDSLYAPYQTLSGSVGQFYTGPIYFYRTSPEADWQRFVVSVQSVPSCSEYNTEDIRKAFAGDICVDPATNKQTLVRPLNN